MTVNLLDVGSGFKRTAINSNFTTIESELNNNVLVKDGSQQLEADLDFNSNKAINLADGVNNKDAVNVQQLNGAIAAASSGLIASQQETQKGSEASGQVFTFTGITYTVGGNNLYVFHNGVKLTKGRDYTETSSSSITMVSGYTINANDDFDFITNIATTSSVSDTAAITHTEDYTTYNLATYLQNRHVVSVKDYGAVGDGVTDDTAAIESVMSQGGRIYIPAGTYYVDYLNIYDDTYVQTDGVNTIIKHKPQAGEQRIIQVKGSNSHLETIRVEGNISTDTGEQNHALFIDTLAQLQPLSNFTFENIEVQDIRGDAVYIRGFTGNPTSGIKGGKVYGDNVYRNGVSIVGGSDISIQSIDVDRVSLLAFDIEPEPSYESVSNVSIGYIKGRAVGLQAASATRPIDGVVIDHMDINSTHSAPSTPEYGGSQPTVKEDGFILRNIQNVIIHKAKIFNYNSFGITEIFNAGELGCEYLEIGHLEIGDCSLTDTTNNAFIDVRNCGFMELGYVEADVQQVSAQIKYLMTGVSGNGHKVVVRGGEVSLGTGCAYMRGIVDGLSEGVLVTGTGDMLSGGLRTRIVGGSFTGTNLCNTTNNPVQFQDFVATVSGTLFSGGIDRHIAINSTLDGTYYALGFTARNYQAALQFGANWLWVDSTGDLRIKSTTAPTSDTDGTVVGTQS